MWFHMVNAAKQVLSECLLLCRLLLQHHLLDWKA